MACELKHYEKKDGKSPFDEWFASLNAQAANKITQALFRLENENFSNVDPVGEGISECKINWGPGYRIYFGRDGSTIIILLHGGHKKTQNVDIKLAKEYWKQYKSRKKKGE